MRKLIATLATTLGLAVLIAATSSAGVALIAGITVTGLE
jgi:multisubunit Na+/H+ antiporter MnhB subunit